MAAVVDDAKPVNPVNPVDNGSVKQNEQAQWELALAAQASAQRQQGVKPLTPQQTQQGINRIATLNTTGGGQPAQQGVQPLTQQQTQQGINRIAALNTAGGGQPAQQKDEPFFKIDKGKVVIGGVTPGVGVDRTFEVKNGVVTPKDVPFFSLKTQVGPIIDGSVKLKFDPKALGVDLAVEGKLGGVVSKAGYSTKIEQGIVKTLQNSELFYNGAVGKLSGKAAYGAAKAPIIELQIGSAGGNVAGSSKVKSAVTDIGKTLRAIFSPTDTKAATVASDAAKAATVASDAAKAATVASDAAKGASLFSKALKVAGPILKVGGEIAGPVGFVLPFIPDDIGMKVNTGLAAANYVKGAFQWVTGDQQGAAQSFGTANAQQDQSRAHALAAAGRLVSPVVAYGNEVVNKYNAGLKEGSQINPVLGVVDGLVSAAGSALTTAPLAGATQFLIGGDGAADAASKAAASHDIGKTATAIVQGTQKDQKEIAQIVPDVVNWIGNAVHKIATNPSRISIEATT